MDLNTALKRLRQTYIVLLSMPILLLAASILRGGVLQVAKTDLAFRSQTLLVIMAIVSIPLAWQLMQFSSVRRAIAPRTAAAIRSYTRFSILRMFIVCLPAAACFAASHFQMDDTNAILGIMLTLGFLLLWPTERLYRYDIGQEK